MEVFLEVFMDDLYMFGDSFDDCLDHLGRVLKRCEGTNLVLNWETVTSWVSGVSWDILVSIGVSSSKIANLLCKLLKKEAKFEFDETCRKAFDELKERLTTAPIIVSPDCSRSFELMYDVSDFANGVVLGQRLNKIMHHIYYASKILNVAQMNYTVTE
ncbi:uncharacterized protein LOC132612799 [Lycium barbarum]|uniref:uncharacterized protein LOC132612799 n=1 Tax=Lycium barbarum TaxID=112863 RepID=UPI00293EC3BD|nr:uncharacterized protein LOC132612799 [Lycium barbarum]